MARIDLSNAAKRDALPPRSSYYSHSLRSKRYLLLRKGKLGAKWGVRLPGQPDRVIGDAASMSFNEAVALVTEITETGIAGTLRTIGNALDAYVATADKTKGTASMAVIRGHARACEPLRAETTRGCTLPVLNRWKTALLTDRRGTVGANKIIGTLKAALNSDGIDGPWLNLRKFKEPRSERASVLAPEQVKQVIADADPDIQVLLQALWLTGARPGEIIASRRADFHGTALTLSGKTGTRDITLTPRVTAFFEERAEGCNTHLIEFDGKPLNAQSHRYRWSPPEGVTLYTIRHSYITAALYAGLPVFPLARHCGTSVEMVERIYGHIMAQLQAKAFAAMDEIL